MNGMSGMSGGWSGKKLRVAWNKPAGELGQLAGGNYILEQAASA